MTVRRYSLAESRRFVGGGAVVALLMTATGAWMFYGWFSRDDRPWAEGASIVAWLCVLMVLLFQHVTSARAIVVHEGDEIEFVSVVERQRLMARDIRSIRVSSGRSKAIVVRHSSGKIRLAGPMNDFHQFVTELRQAYPGIERVGC